MRGVIPGSPADESAIRQGDIITAVDGESNLFKRTGGKRRVAVQRGAETTMLILKLRPLA